MSSAREPGRWLAGMAIVAGTAGAVLTIAGAKTGARALVLVFLLIVPALAIGGLLTGFDPLARAVVAGAAAITMNLLVAEAMILTGTWSVRTGVALVALLSALILVARLLVARRGQSGALRAGRPPIAR